MLIFMFHGSDVAFSFLVGFSMRCTVEIDFERPIVLPDTSSGTSFLHSVSLCPFPVEQRRSSRTGQSCACTCTAAVRSLMEYVNTDDFKGPVEGGDDNGVRRSFHVPCLSRPNVWLFVCSAIPRTCPANISLSVSVYVCVSVSVCGQTLNNDGLLSVWCSDEDCLIF